MMTRHILPILTVCCMMAASDVAWSQQIRTLSASLRQARELYSRNEFISAGNLFASIEGKSTPGSKEHAEASFFRSVCALRLGNPQGEELLKKYISRYPENVYAGRARFELASSHFNNQRYEEALLIYSEANISGLSPEEQSLMTYQKGYALFEKARYAEAETEFEKLKDDGGRIADQAVYYLAHIKYLDGEYDTALDYFNKLSDKEAFAPIIPYYISHIYFRQGRYADVVALAKPLMEVADEQQKVSLAGLLANSCFQLNDFGQALPFFEFYFVATDNTTREDNYMLGYCYYTEGRYPEALLYLEHAAKGDDLLAQSAYYHIADCHIKTNDKNKAATAFEAASKMDFNPEIKEDALFNHAKITYELSYSPLHDTIRVFDNYISLYPYSDRNKDAYGYLANIYMSTSNFKDAVASMEKIQVKTPDISKALQRAAFYNGLELVNTKEYREALKNFDKSLANGEHDGELKTKATFWRGEMFYMLEDYNQAVRCYNDFINTQGAFRVPEYNTVRYNLGYALFNTGKLEQAIVSFGRFIEDQNVLYGEASANPHADKLGDAYNRLGDCYFAERDYRNAIKNYERAFELNSYEPDYALYRKALCLGLQQEQEQKISSLRSLLQLFPQSALVDDAMYELGRTYERINEPRVAAGYYNDLLNDSPRGQYYTKALLQLGLIHYNLSDYNKSLEYYKNITDNYPDSPDVQAAMLGIRNNYMEMNNLDAYFEYANRAGARADVGVSTTDQDSLSYMAAEKAVMSESAQARAHLERYLQQFPDGGFAVNAHFYLAEVRYAAGEYTAALADYEYVLSNSDNIFTEQALAKAAELKYNAGNYDDAHELYKRLGQISTNKWNIIKARAGIMRSLFRLGQYPESVEAANIMLATEDITDVMQREGTFILAKSLMYNNDFPQATPLLQKLAGDTQSQEGAESKYLVAEILVKQDKNEEAENEIMDFISQGTPHQYWLAKSFILLSDIYLSKDDAFQAIHTLKSIVENYPVKDDGIIETADSKMKVIEQMEKQDQ